MNYKLPKLKKIAQWATCLALFSPLALKAEKDKLSVLIIDGQNNHSWEETTPVLKHALEESGIYTVTVSTSPKKKSKPKAWDSWRPDFKAYDAVLSNYNGESWPDEVKKDFVDYVKNGGGFIVVHAADNAFGKWKEYNEIIGVGGWGGKWMKTKDELYCNLCGPAHNLEVQATALSRRSKKNEPMIMTVTYGKGRVFHTTLGHDVEAMQCRGFYEIMQRGTEWTITGKVERTADVPDDFPTETKTSPVKP